MKLKQLEIENEKKLNQQENKKKAPIKMMFKILKGPYNCPEYSGNTKMGKLVDQ